MKQRAPAAKEKIDTEELLNFELDEESSLDLDSLGEDETVIDLIDLVEKGEGKPLAEDRLKATGAEELDLEGLDLEIESDEVPKKSSPMNESQGKEELYLSDITMELGGEEGLQGKVSEMPAEDGDVIEADLDAGACGRFTQYLFAAIPHRQQAYDALLNLNDTVFEH